MLIRVESTTEICCSTTMIKASVVMMMIIMMIKNMKRKILVCKTSHYLDWQNFYQEKPLTLLCLGLLHCQSHCNVWICLLWRDTANNWSLSRPSLILPAKDGLRGMLQHQLSRLMKTKWWIIIGMSSSHSSDITLSTSGKRPEFEQWTWLFMKWPWKDMSLFY